MRATAPRLAAWRLSRRGARKLATSSRRSAPSYDRWKPAALARAGPALATVPRLPGLLRAHCSPGARCGDRNGRGGDRARAHRRVASSSASTRAPEMLEGRKALVEARGRDDRDDAPAGRRGATFRFPTAVRRAHLHLPASLRRGSGRDAAELARVVSPAVRSRGSSSVCPAASGGRCGSSTPAWGFPPRAPDRGRLARRRAFLGPWIRDRHADAGSRLSSLARGRDRGRAGERLRLGGGNVTWGRR